MHREENMSRGRNRLFIAFLAAVSVCIWGVGYGYSQEKLDVKGWERNSVYNKLYDLDEWDKWKGHVIGFKEVTPMPGMSPGFAMIIRDKTDSDEIITVHIGPKAYVDSVGHGFRKGDKVTVRGVWAEIEGKDVFIASKVKKGDYYSFKIRRSKDGAPYWAMTQEELEKEKAKE
jgi:hypothetical protein